MTKPVPQGIGGWLLVYLAWAALGIAYAIGTNLSDLLVYQADYPFLVPSALVTLLLVLLFYGYYAFLLYRLCLRRAGIISRIKAMILLTPIFNGVLPCIFAITISLTVPFTDFASILRDAYPPPLIGSICGAAVMALIWHRYFCTSQRVKATWPAG